jgi:protein-tyrosine phosphatase
MPGILFVCTGNLYRSPLAAAFFSSKLQADGQAGNWDVASAGTWTIPGQRVPADVLKQAATLGMDLKNHLTQQVDQSLLARYDLIIVMEKGHKEALQIEFPTIQERVRLLSEAADQMEYNIEDPANSGSEMSQTFAEMRRLIERAYPKICELAHATP